MPIPRSEDNMKRLTGKYLSEVSLIQICRSDNHPITIVAVCDEDT